MKFSKRKLLGLMTGVAAVVSMAGTNLAFAQSGEPIKFGLAMPGVAGTVWNRSSQGSPMGCG